MGVPTLTDHHWAQGLAPPQVADQLVLSLCGPAVGSDYLVSWFAAEVGARGIPAMPEWVLVPLCQAVVGRKERVVVALLLPRADSSSLGSAIERGSLALAIASPGRSQVCLLYTSDAADE